MSEVTPLSVDVRGLSVAYPHSRSWALRSVDVTFPAGSETWVTGPNSSGKSTLLSAIAGVLQNVIDARVEGSVEFGDGAAGRTISMALQDSGVYLFSTVFDEVAYPLENAGIGEDELADAVEMYLSRVGASALIDREMHTLSGGERQKVALATALARTPGLLLLDEPFEQLDPSSARELLQVVRECGATLVIATRDESRIPPDARRVRLGALPAAVGACGVRRSRDTGEPLLEMRGVGHRFESGGGIDSVDLVVHGAECVAVIGPNGAGKTTLMRHAIGLHRPQHGMVRVCARDIASIPVWEVAHDVGLLFQNPDDQLFNPTVRSEVAWSLTARGVSVSEVESRVARVMDELGLGHIADANPHDLTASGRQLVAFASVLVTEPRLIVLDEPTKALDSQATEVVACALDRRLDRGCGALVVTHDLTFARRVADSCAVLDAGTIVASGPTDEVLADEAMLVEARLVSGSF